MRKLLFTGTAAALLSIASFAEDPAKQSSPTSEPYHLNKPLAAAESKDFSPDPAKIGAWNKASAFIGTSVMNDQGKSIGKVQDLVIDTARGKLAYAVVCMDLASGTGGRSVAVPFSALKPADNYLVLNMSESVLAAAEGLVEGNWPDTNAFSLEVPETSVGAPAATESDSSSSSSDTKSEDETD